MIRSDSHCFFISVNRETKSAKSSFSSVAGTDVSSALRGVLQPDASCHMGNEASQQVDSQIMDRAVAERKNRSSL